MKIVDFDPATRKLKVFYAGVVSEDEMAMLSLFVSASEKKYNRYKEVAYKDIFMDQDGDIENGFSERISTFMDLREKGLVQERIKDDDSIISLTDLGKVVVDKIG